MGTYDTVFLPCPKCGTKYDAQSKSGKCELETYELGQAPQVVMDGIHRHAPFSCLKCGTLFCVTGIGYRTVAV